jgi:GntR family frlABCD operon transcriptional regulator
MILDRQFTYREKICDIKHCAELLGITEIEVTKAFDKLINDNFVIKDGNSYLINQYDFSSDFFSKIIKVYDAIKDLGLTPSMEETQRKIIKADKALSEKSKFKVGSKLLYFRRVYKGNGQPLIILDLYYDLNLLPDFDKHVNDENPIYETLYQTYNNIITKSHRIIDVVNLPKDISKIFNVKPQTAGFKVTAETYNQFEDMIEYTEGYSADNYAYEFELPVKEILSDYKIMNQNL